MPRVDEGPESSESYALVDKWPATPNKIKQTLWNGLVRLGDLGVFFFWCLSNGSRAAPSPLFSQLATWHLGCLPWLSYASYAFRG